MNPWEHRWSVVGFLALAFGNALGAVHMFRGNVLTVMVSVGLMFVGFQVMHYGFHGGGIVTRLSQHSSGNEPASAVRGRILPLALLLVAVYCIAQGFVIGAQAAIHSFTLVDMGLSGAFVVGGYVTGHMAVHGVPL